MPKKYQYHTVLDRFGLALADALRDAVEEAEKRGWHREF